MEMLQWRSQSGIIICQLQKGLVSINRATQIKSPIGCNHHCKEARERLLIFGDPRSNECRTLARLTPGLSAYILTVKLTSSCFVTFSSWHVIFPITRLLATIPGFQCFLIP